eukprot:PhM_4_TR11888/c0_g1_i1/m.43390/K04082/hscB, HSCB, HSC20; molecular chaperone HscB
MWRVFRYSTPAITMNKNMRWCSTNNANNEGDVPVLSPEIRSKLTCHSYFKMFDQPVAVRPDAAWFKHTTQAYRHLQGMCHPDVSPDDNDVSTRLNAAYETLKHPVLRCRYILQTEGGVNTNSDEGGEKVVMTQSFLMEMFEHNMAVAEFASGERNEIKDVLTEMKSKLEELLVAAERTYEAKDWAAMSRVVAEMTYVQTLIEKISDAQLKRDLS